MRHGVSAQTATNMNIDICHQLVDTAELTLNNQPISFHIFFCVFLFGKRPYDRVREVE